MNKNIMEKVGFVKELKLVDDKKCPLCEQDITEFNDELSIKEYKISGLCQSCQDDVFG